MAKGKKSTENTENKTEQIAVSPPNLQTATVRVYGSSPYVQHKFSQKAKMQMLATQQATKGTSRKSREPRDVEGDYRGAMHLTPDGRHGIPASAFRSACISACRVAGLVMTRAKLSIFCLPDDFDEEDGEPLVLLNSKTGPEQNMSTVRLESGVASVAVRPMWREWTADVRLQWDGDQFNEQDVVNLLERAGQQVGIGEGRNDSRKSNGKGWGCFTVCPPDA